LYKKEFDISSFDSLILKYTPNEIYRALLDYYDPVLRAITLLELIRESEINRDNLHKLPFNIQDPDEGRTYFYMHPVLRNALIQLIIEKKST